MYHLEVEFNNETGNLVYNRKLKEGEVVKQSADREVCNSLDMGQRI